MAQQTIKGPGTARRPRTADGELWLVGLALSADDVGRARRWLLVTGVLSLLAGAAAIAVPAVASVAIAIFIGWILMFAGVVIGLHAFSLRSGTDKTLRLLDAALALLVGFYLVAFPLSGTVTLTLLLAVWFFGTGALSLYVAWRSRGRPGTGWLTFGGALSVVLGLLLAVDLPSAAEWAIGLLVGINLIFWGVRALIAASLLEDMVEGTRAR